MSEQPDEPGVSWHAIRPWTPHLILTVREITSVSATFILSSSLSTPAEDAAVDVSEHEQDDFESQMDAADLPEGAASTLGATARGIIADALSGSKGLSVSVNGSPWQRVLIRLHDPLDEAIIIIYGLMPGRQYDIDLGLVQGGQASSIRKQVVTEEVEGSTENDRMEEGASSCFFLPSSSSSSITSSSIEPNHTLPSPSCASQAPRSVTPPQEDRLPALQSTLSSLQAQITNLTATLKSTRRDSQKADAALKSEIEALNRASEKAGVAEAKARQRIRALEDSVRKANEGKEDIDRIRCDLEGEVPGLREQVMQMEEECEALQKEACKVRKEREAKEEARRRCVEGVKADIGSTEHRLERLSGRQEKLEGTVLPDLEKTLREIEREIEEVESGSSGNGFSGQYPAPIGRPTQIPPVSPPQYRRHQPRTPTSYRMGQDGAPLSNLYAVGTLPHVPSSTLSHSTSPHSKIPALSHSTSPGLSHASPGSVFPSATLTSTSGMSTLSSKAAPFEPTRHFRSSFPPLSPPPGIAPIQRPIGTGMFQRTGRSLSNGLLDEGT